MVKTVQVSARVTPEVKKKAAEVLEKQGLDIPTAIKMLITKTAYEDRLPIDLINITKYKLTDEQIRSELDDIEFKKNVFKTPGKIVDWDHPENMAEFFDEDYPEYRNEETKDDKK